MNKLFGLFLLALAFFAPGQAQATAKFLVFCTATCTWDNTNDAIWSLSSNGANNTTHPVAGDAVTIDASSCVGGVTCTITTGAGTISAQSITWGACTASTTGCIIDASANNTNFTLNNSTGAIFSGTGTGTRKWLAGTGTYNITRSSSASWFTMNVTTNDQGSVFSGATWIFSGTTANGANLLLGGFSYGPMTINGNTSGGSVTLSSNNTFAALAVNSPNTFGFPVGGTQTITGALTLNGSSASSMINITNNQDPASGAITISIGSASTGSFALLRNITTTGAAALTVSNCFNAGQLTLANGGACNAPSGIGGGGRIIGG